MYPFKSVSGALKKSDGVKSAKIKWQIVADGLAGYAISY